MTEAPDNVSTEEKPLVRDRPADWGGAYDLSAPVESLPKQVLFAPRSKPTRASELDDPFERGPASRLASSRLPPVLATVLLSLTGAASFWYSIEQDVLLGQIAIPIMTLASLHGLWRGGFHKLAMLLVVAGLAYVTFAHADRADQAIRAVTGSSSGAASDIVICLLVVMTVLVSHFLLRRFRRRHIATRPVLLTFDRLVGTGIGLAEGTFVMLCFCWVVVMVRPHMSLVRDHRDTEPGSFRHQIATTLVRLADEASAEPLGDFVEATNLISSVPVLSQAIDSLNGTGRINLGGLSPPKTKILNDLLPELTGRKLDTFEDLIEQYEKGNKARERAYRQLPPPQNRRR